MNKTKKLLIVVLLCSLLVTTLAGCKEKVEPAATTETKESVSAVVEQTTCPVMGGAINKELFTEYKGKKVYFCCSGCKGPFEKNPEKYIDKLPQFKN